MLFNSTVFKGVTSPTAEGPEEPALQAQTPPTTKQTVYDILQSEPSLASFKTLVEAAALHDNLQQDGPFTVFAPTNEAWAAFEAMAAGTDTTMTDILLRHVLNGEYPAAAIHGRRALPTLAGGYLFFNAAGPSSVDAAPNADVRLAAGANAGLTINETVNVVRADIQASNGVVHVIDAVIPTPEANSLFASTQGSPDASAAQVLAIDGRFDTFLSLAEQAGLMGHLEDVGAPTPSLPPPTKPSPPYPRR